MEQKIYILLPVHNRREITRRFIHCLLNQTYQNYHLILIDDGSTDGTAEMVREYIQSLTVIRGKGDWWWSGALQQGYNWLIDNRIAEQNIILIMNDDTLFDRDFLYYGLCYLQSNQNVLLMAECYDEITRKLHDRGVKVNWQKLTFEPAQSDDEINCLATRGLFLRMIDFVKIGGFYPRLIPHYLSDYEFTIRAYNKGIKLCTDKAVKLYYNKSTTGIQTINTTSIYNILETYMSKKSAYYIMSWTYFILLACPIRWMLLNLCRVYGRAYREIRAN